jgi:hypothetical protein
VIEHEEEVVPQGVDFYNVRISPVNGS